MGHKNCFYLFLKNMKETSTDLIFFKKVVYIRKIKYTKKLLVFFSFIILKISRSVVPNLFWAMPHLGISKILMPFFVNCLIVFGIDSPRVHDLPMFHLQPQGNPTYQKVIIKISLCHKALWNFCIGHSNSIHQGHRISATTIRQLRNIY